MSMGVRDIELKRLEHYAKAMGIKVIWKDYVPHTHTRAEWVSDGSEITIYIRPRDSKVKLIMAFIHELSHHLGWVYAGRPGAMKSDNLLLAEDAGETLTKAERKVLYQEETNDYKFRQLIYDEVGIKIPLHIFTSDVKLDEWIYYRYYMTGKYPTYRNIKRKKKELLEKYKNEGHS